MIFFQVLSERSDAVVEIFDKDCRSALTGMLEAQEESGGSVVSSGGKAAADKAKAAAKAAIQVRLTLLIMYEKYRLT